MEIPASDRCKRKKKKKVELGDRNKSRLFQNSNFPIPMNVEKNFIYFECMHSIKSLNFFYKWP